MGSRYRVNKRTNGFCIEELAQSAKWIRCGGPYSHKTSALNRLQKLREDEELNEKMNVGQAIISSKMFCSIGI